MEHNQPTSQDIRKQFLDFFRSKDHTIVRSASVIPWDDPTLLFTNAGMNQFKSIFLGLTKAEYPRVADTQKCIRAGGKHNDLEEVGRDGYHHTMFEMLGNWSFGDYYKREAIAWAWELFTDVWKLPKDRLFATVYREDQEAHDLWAEVTDIDPSHIEYHGEKDNFWEMGETGPCGPCSEINYDRGPDFCDKQHVPGHVCRVNGDCSRYIELWNLVFIQYNRIEDGSLVPLKDKFVDTGAGFERLCQVLQGKTSNYETDIFSPIIRAIADITGVDYDPGEQGTSHRVIADHIRALSFAIADGGMPSNEGRGYVLRRILRRAARHGRILNQHKPFLFRLVDTLADEMGGHFSELVEKRNYIRMVIQSEEERFNHTLDRGLDKFAEITANQSMISGADAFMLYDTFGFPLDLTRMLAEEKGLSIDEAGFSSEMDKQRKRARESAQFKLNIEDIQWTVYNTTTRTLFSGYLTEAEEGCRILRYHLDDDNQVRLVLDKSPFYAESGGQVADMGRVYNENLEIRIDDVQKVADMTVHIGELLRGAIADAPVSAVIDRERRLAIARNHTATHLLHAALRKTLGDHVQQKGSMVHPDYLRFDFTHFRQLSDREIQVVEELVNAEVRKCTPTTTRVTDIDTARAEGAMALFGEKYGEIVRMVEVPGFSKELCGGTHLANTGEIGMIVITGETSIAAGVRRLEAVTGPATERYCREGRSLLAAVGQMLSVKSEDLFERIGRLNDDLRAAQREIEALKMKSAGSKLDGLIAKAENANGIRVLATRIEAGGTEELRGIGDQLRDKLGSGIGLLAAVIDGKVSLLAVVTRDLVGRFNAGKIVQKAAEAVDGRGGGKPDMAMAGGRDTGKIDTALNTLRTWLL